MASIRLSEPMETRLGQLARATRRSKSFFIKEALERYLEEMEDAYLALERIAKPKRRFKTSDEVLRGLQAPARHKKP